MIISYAIAAVSALLSALCYAEFATEIPIAGGAMSYTSITAGPLLGWSAFPHVLSTHTYSNVSCTLTVLIIIVKLLPTCHRATQKSQCWHQLTPNTFPVTQHLAVLATS